MSTLPDEPGTPLPAGRYLWATTAIHKLGDISRDEGDLCTVFWEDDANWYGNWVTGFGFVHVRFPKETTRCLTADEERVHGLRLPDEPPVVDLDNWSLISNQDGWKAPEQVVTRLHGVCKGHPRLDDGSTITTTRLTGRRSDLVATRNTLYRLGNIDPAYAALFPKAKTQILATLPEV